MKVIFIVDDDASHLRVCERILKKAGYAVVTASNGRDALRVLSQTTVDLMLTDLVMPEADGLEILTALRSSKKRSPIIAMSGSGTEAMRDLLLKQAKFLGAVAVLAKPFGESRLIDAVSNALRDGVDPVVAALADGTTPSHGGASGRDDAAGTE